jgi:hypothetical protein
VRDLNDDLAPVRRRFRACEMMLLAGSFIGRTNAPISFAKQVRKDVAAPSGVFPMMIKKFDINADYLVTKLQAMPPELMEVLLAQLGEWHRLDIDEMIANNGLPSISTLQRLGLIEPDKGEVAWGLLCFRNGSSSSRASSNWTPRSRRWSRCTFYGAAGASSEKAPVGSLTSLRRPKKSRRSKRRSPAMRAMQSRLTPSGRGTPARRCSSTSISLYRPK